MRVRLLITALTTVQVTNLYPKMVCCASSTAVPQMDSSCLPQLSSEFVLRFGRPFLLHHSTEDIPVSSLYGEIFGIKRGVE